ncbi:hypothetical protein [Chryseobacterium sp. W4I1]|uniref:hypothetical protein n=1 Tax=Chryseobacterium sp. W4I1 TaxID=3042293 RepID=UPI00277FB3AE|nr:hypothetical protein [Chryseobacterium sp. W4I1]MDQ0781591.1 hypothetical protein [Chryseobacterium sp. W4I1]
MAAYILENTSISALSVYDLLKHTSGSAFLEIREFHDIYPIAIENNNGLFTKNLSLQDFPSVSVSQIGHSLASTCTCSSSKEKLCEHQAEIICGILEEKNFRIFFDPFLRKKLFIAKAKIYGLENEADLDTYFELEYAEGKTDARPKIKEMLPIDEDTFKQYLLPQRSSVINELALQENGKKKILVIGRHRYYSHLNFSLMEAETTQAGKIKNPVNSVDAMQLIWKAEEPMHIKFYTAVNAFQNNYNEDYNSSELEALKLIVQNPMGFETYYHDRDLSETVSSKSLVPVNLENFAGRNPAGCI